MPLYLAGRQPTKLEPMCSGLHIVLKTRGLRAILLHSHTYSPNSGTDLFSSDSGASLPVALALPFVPAIITASQLIFKVLHKTAQAGAQHLTDIPELDQIQPAQPTFYVADK